MTLNLTFMGSGHLLQVSDRRLTTGDTFALAEDSANKALVLRCVDGIVGVTYSGLGAWPPASRGPSSVWNYMDQWLATELLDWAAPERTIDEVTTRIAVRASRLWGTFPSGSRSRHVFVVGGFRHSSGGSRPCLSFVANDAGWQSPASATFRVEDHPIQAGALYCTGTLPAFTREVRRRFKGRVRKVSKIDRLEELLVEAVREAAAADPQERIGKNCMAIAIANSGACRATYFPEAGDRETMGPYFLWNAGGRNFAVGRITVVPGPGWSLLFGDVDRPLQLIGSGSGFRTQPNPDEFNTGFDLRMSDTITGQAVKQVTVVQVGRVPETGSP